MSNATHAQQKTLQAIKAISSPRIDGSLDDAAWKNAPVATNFITNSPVYGNAANKATIVKVIYDDANLYIGAYLFDNPDSIRKQFTTRDGNNRADVDYFAVFIDTYKDRQNGFQFLATTRNVQSDARLSASAETGFGEYGDLSWDAVWDSKVAFHKDGWSVEFRIPFYSLRFSKNNIQDWGINFLRFSRRNNEGSFWNPVNPNENGFVNQFGDLSGLQNLLPPLRLSFSPYISGGYRTTPSIFQGRINEALYSGGLDVKYGINESFTLDATLIPDFGQVISDNIVNNLTPYEVQFRENRPFFTEGTELFNKAGTFYSRRIGDLPAKYYDVKGFVESDPARTYTIKKNPEVNKLYNAIKLSGRTKDNLGIGIFNAITAPSYAKLKNNNTGADSSIQTEGLTNYNIIVLDQALKNRSSITFTNTNVLRNGTDRDANVTALDIALYDKHNRFGVTTRGRYSKIFSANGYDGFAATISGGKVSGKWQYGLTTNIESDKYDPNDLGILRAPNEIQNEAEISYNIFTPTKHFLNHRFSLGVEQSYLYKPTVFQKNELRASAFFIFKNFWDLSINSYIAPTWYNDYFEMQTPRNLRQTPRQNLRRSQYYSLFAEGSSDSRKKLFGRWEVGFAEGPQRNDPFFLTNFGMRYRFSDRLSVDISYNRQYDRGQFGYAFIRNTNGSPILARRKFYDATTIVSGVYNFTSRMNLTFRARHYWNRIENTHLFDIDNKGNWDWNNSRTDLNPSDYNQNYNAFNLDVFYVWDFKLGCRIIAGWKNWLGRDYEDGISGNKYTHYLSNAAQLFTNPHGNEFTFRVIYFIDYMQLRKKK